MYAPNKMYEKKYVQLKRIMLDKDSLKDKLENELKLDYDLALSPELPVNYRFVFIVFYVIIILIYNLFLIRLLNS